MLRTVTAALQELESNPEFWDTYVSDPDAAVNAYIESKQSPEQVEMARKGTKLKNLQKLKKGTAKKCKCGCDLTMKKRKRWEQLQRYVVVDAKLNKIWNILQ